MATLKEISEHPENVTQEDIRYFVESVRLLGEIGKKMDYYKGLQGETGITAGKIAYSYYIDYSIYAAILNSFCGKQSISYADINKQVFSHIDEDFYYHLTIPKYQTYLLRLCWLDLIKCIDEGNGEESLMIFEITDKGKESLRQQTFANIAQSALFNYNASIVDRRSLETNIHIKRLTKIGLVIAIAAIIIPIILRII